MELKSLPVKAPKTLAKTLAKYNLELKSLPMPGISWRLLELKSPPVEWLVLFCVALSCVVLVCFVLFCLDCLCVFLFVCLFAEGVPNLDEVAPKLRTTSCGVLQLECFCHSRPVANLRWAATVRVVQAWSVLRRRCSGRRLACWSTPACALQAAARNAMRPCGGPPPLRPYKLK